MADLCDFGKGTCWFGIKEFRGETRAKYLTDQIKKFRDAYCNPCLESKKLTVLQDISNELTRIRESKVRPREQLSPTIGSDTCTCNIGTTDLLKAADLIRAGFKPQDDQVSTAPPHVPMMGETNRNPSIWVCSGCFTVITNMEYEHVNKDGCCKECGNALYQYEEVE